MTTVEQNCPKLKSGHFAEKNRDTFSPPHMELLLAVPNFPNGYQHGPLKSTFFKMYIPEFYQDI